HTARQVLMYLEDSSQPESRREWLLHMFSYFAAGKKNKQTYQVWQNGNHPIELYSAEVIEQKLTYIHENAVRAGWVDAPEQWLYSSAAFYGGGKSFIPITPLW
ncbi:MAG: transposase, partial [Bacteroidetes bacterium]